MRGRGDEKASRRWGGREGVRGGGGRGGWKEE